MSEIWMSDSSYKKAIANKQLTVVGHNVLTRNITSWMQNSVFADSL